MNKTYVTTLSTEKTLYIMGLVAAGAACVTLIVLHFFDLELTKLPMVCSLRLYTGAYCPGCGGTRAFVYMMHGHFLKSLYYNPFVLYFFFFYTWFMISHTLSIFTKNKIKSICIRPVCLYIGLAILLLQWIIKNVALFAFHIELIA